MAEALRDWLPLVLHYLEPWTSGRDIPAGERWSTEISNELENTNFGIICLTKGNLKASWIMFEAGAISKAVSAASVCPYLLDTDFSDIPNTDPLSQFQAKKSDKSSTLELLRSINQKAPTPIPSSRLEQLFEVLWPQLQQRLANIPKDTEQTPEHRNDTDQTSSRPPQEILEELVGSVRSVDGRLDQLETTVRQIRSTSVVRRNRPSRTSSKPVSVLIDIVGTDFNKGDVVRILPSENLSFDKLVAQVTGLDPETHWTEWDLRNPTNHDFADKQDCADIEAFLGDSPYELVLEESPPF